MEKHRLLSRCQSVHLAQMTKRIILKAVLFGTLFMEQVLHRSACLNTRQFKEIQSGQFASHASAFKLDTTNYLVSN